MWNDPWDGADKNNDGVVDKEELQAAAASGQLGYAGAYAPHAWGHHHPHPHHRHYPAYGRFVMHPKYKRFIGMPGTGPWAASSDTKMGKSTSFEGSLRPQDGLEHGTANWDSNFGYVASLKPTTKATRAMLEGQTKFNSFEKTEREEQATKAWLAIAMSHGVHPHNDSPTSPFDKNNDGAVDEQEMAAAGKLGYMGHHPYHPYGWSAHHHHPLTAEVGATSYTPQLGTHVDQPWLKAVVDNTPVSERLIKKNASAVEKHVNRLSPRASDRPGLRPVTATDLAYASMDVY